MAGVPVTSYQEKVYPGLPPDPLAVAEASEIPKHETFVWLEILATKTAKEVAQTRIAVKLDPMNAYDRRIVHTKLSEWRDVITESEGEGEHRALVIKPKK